MPPADDYLQLPLEELLEGLASPEPAPGGGFAAAVALAMAAALVSMAARHSATQWAEARGAGAQAETLRARAASLAQHNTEAYLAARAALEGNTQSESRYRDQELAAALSRAAEIPLEIGTASANVATLAAEVAANGEPSLRADCAVAASLAVAAAQAAAALVEVNLSTTPGDERIARARQSVTDASEALDRARAQVA